MSSQQTFETRVERYNNGNTIIQAVGAYAPINPLITKAANNTFITTVNTANTNTNLALNNLTTLLNSRQFLCFPIKDTNPNCIQRRITGVLNYLKVEVGMKNGNVVKVAAILKKIRPSGGATAEKVFAIKAGATILVSNVVNGSEAKNIADTNLQWSEAGGTNPPVVFTPGEEVIVTALSGNVLIKNNTNTKGGKVRLMLNTAAAVKQSKSERTFTALIQFLTDTISAINAIGAGFVYSPVDPTLTIAELTSVRNQLETLTDQITAAQGLYGTQNRIRKDLYDKPETGMNARIQLIKTYLKNFPGAINNTTYIEFNDAIKGT